MGLSPARHCMISWGVLIVLLLLLIVVFILPISVQLSEYNHAIDNWSGHITKLKQKISTKPALKEQINNPEYESVVRAFYLRGNTKALAGAELQQQIKMAVERTEGNLVSTQLLTDNSKSVTPKVTIKVRMRGSSADLLDIVHGLESSEPLLFIENVSVRKSKRKTPNSQTSLDIHLTLSGYLYQGKGAE